MMDNATAGWNAVFGIVLIALLVPAGLIGCEQSKPAADAKKEAPAAATESVPAATESAPAAGEAKQEMAAAGVDVPMMAPPSSPGREANDEGVNQAQQGHWDVAEGHFRKALEADPKLAEAQFNLGLALDKLGKHEDAAAAFKKAVELAPDNSKIKDSPILKKHTGM